MIKILNLYAGIGGNRSEWGGGDITAVELNPEIAKIYKDFYPNDNVIVADAHDYLLRHFREYDFIWSSPPCQTHSRATLGNINKEIFSYPDMTLYQEILLLKSLYKGKWVVENVKPYYQPLIEPSFTIGRHYFWSSDFIMSPQFEEKLTENWESIKLLQNAYKFDLTPYKLHTKFKRKILRNCVKPEIGKYIYDKLTKELINDK